ncbi:hypothetical protein INP51_03745 [Blautia liquoris]|uniref:YbbR-like protein n=1 Tax=Blautia liquoris TaxID=2779518 RepID=A0A7M2RIB6_9FIRM|nr:CdaR family protein [Blautia liquoris]QOV20076.1 hypothetical protein INP51_03745 [Blautia liquoris]
MKKNMTKNLTNNLALKIVSLFFAVLIWGIVVGVSNPIEPKTYDVPVTITHANYIQTGKKTYLIDDQYRTIRVKIRDNRQKLGTIKDSDIVVEADLTQIVDMDTDPVFVPLTVSCPGVEDKNITLSRTTIPIKIEDIEQETYNIEADTGDTIPGDDYEVGKVALDPENISISGPKSIISKIDRVKALLDVSGMTADGDRSTELVIYDKNGEELTDDTMSYLRYDIGSTKVKASVDLWKRKENVKMNIHLEGGPASGYQLGEIITSPSEITMVGTDNALSDLAANDNTIDIPVPRDVIDLKNKKSDVRGTLDLTTVFDKDSSIRPSSRTSAIVIKATILPNGSKEFDLDVEAIQKNGLDPSLSLTYDQPTISIRVKASDKKLDAFNPAQMIQASIDLTGKVDGDYPVPVTVKLPEGYEMVDDVQTTVHLKKAEKAAAASAAD